MQKIEQGELLPPLAATDLPQAVQAELAKECPDGRLLREYVLNLFESQTGQRVGEGGTVSGDVLALFSKWWLDTIIGGDSGLDFRTYPRRQPMLFGTFSGKVTSVAQRPCLTCSGLHPLDDQFPSEQFAIRLAASSRQALNKDQFAAFQRAIRRALEGKQLSFKKEQALCVAFTYVIDSKRRDPDLDNLTKAAMDGMWRAFGRDDKHVRHLDVVKICAPLAEEFMIIRIAKSFLNEDRDVVLRTFNHSWAGQETLNIEQFLPPADIASSSG